MQRTCDVLVEMVMQELEGSQQLREEPFSIAVDVLFSQVVAGSLHTK